MARFWFAYPPFDHPDFLARVLGRPADPQQAVLHDHRYVADPSYSHVVGSTGDRVEGGLIEVQLGDDWLLDAEFGVADGYYRRQTLTVVPAPPAEPVEAWVMLGGPSLSWVMQEEGSPA